MPVAKKTVDDGQVLPPAKRPDLTPAQIVSGIPIICELLHSFGVYSLSAPQQQSLSKVVLWAFVLMGTDALHRFGRNLHAAAAKREP